MNKHFAFSKLNALGLLLVIAGGADFAHYMPASAAKWLLVASGIAVVVIRSYFTNTEIAAGKAKMAGVMAIIAAAVVGVFGTGCGSATANAFAPAAAEIISARVEDAIVKHCATQNLGADECTKARNRSSWLIHRIAGAVQDNQITITDADRQAAAKELSELLAAKAGWSPGVTEPVIEQLLDLAHEALAPRLARVAAHHE